VLGILKHINEILSQSRSSNDHNNQEIKYLPEKLDIISDPEKCEKILTSILDELERLSKLRNDGVLTEDEFQLIKKDILNKISRLL
jgi:Short C-terminal domain